MVVGIPGFVFLCNLCSNAAPLVSQCFHNCGSRQMPFLGSPFFFSCGRMFQSLNNSRFIQNYIYQHVNQNRQSVTKSCSSWDIWNLGWQEMCLSMLVILYSFVYQAAHSPIILKFWANRWVSGSMKFRDPIGASQIHYVCDNQVMVKHW